MKPHRTVGEVMHRGIVSCTPDTSTPEVVHTMGEKQVHALVVVDDHGGLLGVVTQTDLLNAGYVPPYAAHFDGMCAWQLMSAPALTVRPETPLEDAVRMITDSRIHRLVVVEEKPRGEFRPVGMLSATDLVRNLEAEHPFPRGDARP